MYLLSKLADSRISLHQYILTLNNSAKYHNIDMKLYTNVRTVSPMLNVRSQRQMDYTLDRRWCDL